MRLRTMIANPANIEMITVGPSGWYLNEFGSNSLNEMVVIIPQTIPNIKPSRVGFNPSPTINQASMAPKGSARADVNVQRKAFHRDFVAKKGYEKNSQSLCLSVLYSKSLQSFQSF